MIIENLRVFANRHRLPLVLQTEASECGLACLAMISSYWGHRFDLASLRSKFPISIKGATLKRLLDVAAHIGLRGRPLKVDLPKLADLALPCVLHWGMNHFVVLKKIQRGSVVIHDPSVGKRTVTLRDLSNSFTGVAIEFFPDDSFKQLTTVTSFRFRDLIGRIRGLNVSLFQLLILGAALQLCALIVPFYLQWIVDEAVVAQDRDLLAVLGVGFLMLAVIQAILSAMRTWTSAVLTTNLNFQWLGNVFTHLLHLPLPYFEKRQLGDLLSRFASVQTIQKGISTQLVETVIDGILVFATITLMVYYSGQLSIIPIFAVCAYACFRRVTFNMQREASAEQLAHVAKQQSHFLESVRGMQSIRLFNRADERRIGWTNILADQFNAELRGVKATIINQSSSALLFGTERVLVIWLAALAVIDSKMSLGMMFAFLSYKENFSSRIVALVDRVYDFQMLRIHADRVADIVFTPAENDVSNAHFSSLSPDIEIKNLTFRYSDDDPYIFRGFNLRIAAGQCVAITGQSGCGKTTLVKILLGLLEPTEGEILVGGQRVSQFGLSNFRDIVGTVMQDDQLFAGSIFDNICFFDPSPNRARVTKCAQMAAIHDDISQMPMTYHTLIGDIGTGMSGGQRQRILLARALYKNPMILVLDEATSHLDMNNENTVNDSIRALNLTRVLVAHRSDTIAMAQRVVTLQNGVVISDTLN